MGSQQYRRGTRGQNPSRAVAPYKSTSNRGSEVWDWSCRSSLVRTEKAARLVTQPIINLVPGRLRQREKKIKDQPRLHRETLFKKKNL